MTGTFIKFHTQKYNIITNKRSTKQEDVRAAAKRRKCVKYVCVTCWFRNCS